VQAAACTYKQLPDKGENMQNKKIILVMGLLIVLVGAAAFVGGRMLNQGVSPLGLIGLGGPMGGKDVMSFAINVIPAEELPETPPEIIGLFVERKDNTVVIASLSMKTGGGGAVVMESRGAESVAGTRADENSGPKVEVVVTNETIIYRETTEIGKPQPGENQTVQQTVEESTLDELNTDSMITVWGRKSGDRIIAEVLFYSNPVMIKAP
jgi:hypothetical protein